MWKDRGGRMARRATASCLLAFILCQTALAADLGSTSTRLNWKRTSESLADYVGQANGWDPNLTRVCSTNFEDAKVQHVLTYDFGVRVNNQQREFTLSEEITPLDYLVPALPAGEAPQPGQRQLPPADGKAGPESLEQRSLGVLEGRSESPVLLSSAPSLPPFTLEGPIELWIEGVTQLRLSMPHDVDAGDVRKVVLAAGAAVTIQGCQEVSLARPLQLPLPLSFDQGNKGALGPLSLVDLAAKLRRAAYGWSGGVGQHSRQLLALRIVKPQSIVAAAPTPSTLLALGSEVGRSSGEEPQGKADGAVALVPRMKVKRLSSSSVELQVKGGEGPPSGAGAVVPVAPGQADERVSLWPFAFQNTSQAQLAGFQEALLAALGDAAHRQGAFQLTKARAGVRKLVSVPFQIELQTREHVNLSTMLLGPQAADDEDGEATTEGGEKKQKQARAPTPLARQQWEVLLEEQQGGDLRPVKLKQQGTERPTLSFSPAVTSGNETYVGADFVPRPPGLRM